MTSVRAKFVCSAILPNFGSSTVFHFNAVYSNDPNSENKAFTDATPSGYMQIAIDNSKPASAMFERGQEYYFDITPVKKAPTTDLPISGERG
jgi:hypothetical protein